MNAMAGGDAAADNEGGPMWGKFFDSIGHDDNDSTLSGSHVPSRSHFSAGDLSHLQQSPHSEVHPNDSASVLDDDDQMSALSGVPKKGVSVPAVPAVPIHLEDGTYVFKFRTPSGRTHRFQSRHDDVAHLREIVAGKLATDPFFTELQAQEEGAIHPDPNDFILSYTDADGDTVLITSDDDVTDAVKIARTAGHDRVVLYVQGGKGWKEAGADKSEEKAKVASENAKAEEKEVEKSEITVTPPEKPSSPAYMPPPAAAAPAPAEEIFGIPKDLLLPASIGALAVVIIGVFTVSRLTSNNY
jgi:hypothetical protein